MYKMCVSGGVDSHWWYMARLESSSNIKSFQMMFKGAD